MAKGRIAVFCQKGKGRTDQVRPCYDPMGLVTLTSWGCYALLDSLRKPVGVLAWGRLTGGGLCAKMARIFSRRRAKGGPALVR